MIFRLLFSDEYRLKKLGTSPQGRTCGTPSKGDMGSHMAGVLVQRAYRASSRSLIFGTGIAAY